MLRSARPLTVVAALAAAAVSGCAAYHTPVDAGPDARDEAGLSCVIAGMSRCDLACGGDAGHGSACLEDPFVVSRCMQGLCIDTGRRDHVDNDCYAHVDGAGYCADDRVCVQDDVFGAGFCVAESVCDEAARVGFPLTCSWSDGTPRVHPATSAECPRARHPGSPFCGPGCDRCPGYATRDPPLRGSCVGRSDTRPIGICIPPANCRRGEWGPDDVCFVAGSICLYPELCDAPCGCVVVRSSDGIDGLADYGWPASIEACRAYRDMYPDQVECVVDRDWHPAP